MNYKKLIIACSLAFMFAVMSAGSESRCCANAGPATMPTPADKPVFTAYRGVEIGMSADDARKKLKNIKDKSDTQETFQFSDNESADVYYDADHKVRAVSITFTGKLDAAPTPRIVFGEDAEAKPDGGIFKMERYPKAGFWISYTRTGGDDPMIMLAIQKM